VSTVLAVAAGVLSCVATLSYIYVVATGAVRPHPFSWAVWAILSSLGLAATLASGAGLGALPVMVIAVTDIIVFAFAWRTRQERDRVSPVLPGLALIGLIGWLTIGDPLIATLAVILADSMGAVPTLQKVWREPHSEPIALWFVSGVSFVLGLGVLAHHSLAAVLYLAYLAAAGLGLSLIGWLRRRMLASAGGASVIRTQIDS
jgi:hypothetical protein